MDVIDHEGHPIHLGWRSIFYWPWLIWEILKSNVQMARVILGRSMPIQPAVFKVRGSQKSELGHVIYGNSITLTPGTVTIGLDQGELTIHALTKPAADGLKSGGMDRRVTAMMGRELEEEIQNGKTGGDAGAKGGRS
jgi:multicomponent Na+:H+ antiporter subunit E